MDQDQFHTVFLQSSFPFNIFKCSKGNIWFFSYTDLSGEIKHHKIKKLEMGSFSIYKNGAGITTNRLETLIDYLTNGVVTFKRIVRNVA